MNIIDAIKNRNIEALTAKVNENNINRAYKNLADAITTNDKETNTNAA